MTPADSLTAPSCLPVGAKQMFPLNPKEAQECVSVGGSRCFSAARARPSAPIPRQPTLGRASARWELDGRAEGRRRACQRLASKGKTPPLVHIPADSRQGLPCGSTVTSASPSPTYPAAAGSTASPLRRARPPPKLSPGRLERREHGREPQHFQGEQECAPGGAAPRFLPHSLFMKTASRWERAARAIL